MRNHLLQWLLRESQGNQCCHAILIMSTLVSLRRSLSLLTDLRSKDERDDEDDKDGDEKNDDSDKDDLATSG